MDEQGGWIRTERGWRKTYSPPAEHVTQGDFPCPMVVSDKMEPVEHVDGNHYDSKSQYRRITKEQGFVEVGNDPARLKRPAAPTPDRQAISDSVSKAMARVGV